MNDYYQLRQNLAVRKRKLFKNLGLIIVGIIIICAIVVPRTVNNSAAENEENSPEAIFANFRNVVVGNLKDNTLYRSASPINNVYNRASTADRFVGSAGINYIVDLSDSEAEIAEHRAKDDFNSPSFTKLYDDGRVIPLSMNTDYREQAFKEKFIKGLTAMSEHSGPYLVHCIEGKDRTGYAMMILEALLGASYNEMVDDYMLTYQNYYDVTLESDPDRYNDIKHKNIDRMLHYTIGDETETEDLSIITDYSDRIKSYLLSLGMEESALDHLTQNLSK